ncbi:MAG: membrane protein insertase YidC [Elusimicrobiota bacterium]|jgi:YidC/Oxa1 family membrane protein insertase
MEQKNLLLAVVLSGIFLLFWSVFVQPRFTQPPLQTPPAQTSATAEIAQKPADLVAPSNNKARQSDDVFFRDQQNEVVLSPMGGRIKGWRLNLKGHEVDLVNMPEAPPLPPGSFSEKIFAITQKNNTVALTGTVDKNLVLTKTLTLKPNGYLHDLTFHFQNRSGQPVEVRNWEWGWGPGLGTTLSEKKENSGLIRALSMGKLKTHVLKPGDYTEFGSWAGIDNRYFLVAFLPQDTGRPELSVTGTKDQTRVAVRESLTVPPHSDVFRHYQLYTGPKGYTQLKKYGKSLEEGVDFGFFSSVGKLILNVIYRLQNWTGNYGWAIVILTIGLQILMFPLTIKQSKSMLAMKRIQPQIAALNKQYKGDPKRLNVEMMNLYKKSGTNPFGGCLPMLLQLPIFWALFTTLRNAYELRGVPWILWVKDLSAPDTLFHVSGVPVNILPLVMGGAMFFQQRMSGAVTDPTQKQMMYFMPIIFTFMFYSFPSGLVLYWLINNLLTMAIQWGFQRVTAPDAGSSTPSVVH